ncbi:MAG: DUF5318 family protein [Actinomycetales bacterium]
MAVPRSSPLRGQIARGQRATPPRPGPLPASEPVADPTRPRSVIDFTLQRRQAITALRRGGALTSEGCDADPYLLRAARHHGESAPGPCPACRDAGLMHVTYVYGDELGPHAGRIRASHELPAMARRFGAFTVYVVEVCQRCHWNFLTTSYVLGDGVPRRPLRDRDG